MARTINVELECELLFPVFVGLLTHSAGHRLVVLDGLNGRLDAGLASAMTSNYRYIMDELDRNRLLSLG